LIPCTLGKPRRGGKDHYHRHNPKSTEKQNEYLDKNGKPIGRGKPASHLKPGEEATP
jgi:hypothetical protein